MRSLRILPRLLIAAVVTTVLLPIVPDAVGQGRASAFRPSEGELVLIQLGNLSVYCARSEEEWVVGRFNSRTLLFTPSETIVLNKQKQRKRLKGNRLTRLLKSIKGERNYIRRAKSICEGASPLLPSPTPTPTPTGVATPLPTPEFDRSCFETNGDSKPGCFGIPEGWIGNRERGAIYFASNCTFCHGEQSDKSYDELQELFSLVQPMSPFKPSVEQDFVDVVAFLNRASR